jgi:2-iminoacetate synthase ThiH
MRRALRRVTDGRPLDVDEAATLLAARWEALDQLLAVAAAVRDAGLADAGRPGVVTYSKKVFIPLTRLCRDRCHYCTFVTVPHRVPAPYLDRDEVVAIAKQGAELGCKEALFTLGDRPEERWQQAREWLDARVRVHPGLPARVCDRRARGDRPAAASQPGCHVVGGVAAAQAGGAEHGHDARDHRDPALE